MAFLDRMSNEVRKQVECCDYVFQTPKQERINDSDVYSKSARILGSGPSLETSVSFCHKVSAVLAHFWLYKHSKKTSPASEMYYGYNPNDDRPLHEIAFCSPKHLIIS